MSGAAVVQFGNPAKPRARARRSDPVVLFLRAIPIAVAVDQILPVWACFLTRHPPRRGGGKQGVGSIESQLRICRHLRNPAFVRRVFRDAVLTPTQEDFAVLRILYGITERVSDSSAAQTSAKAIPVSHIVSSRGRRFPFRPFRRLCGTDFGFALPRSPVLPFFVFQQL